MVTRISTPFICMKCGHCCRDLIFTITERNIILNFMEKEGISLEIQTDFLLRCTPDYKGTPLISIKGPCPLLGEDKQCCVYPIRPWNCRNFLCGRTTTLEPLEYDAQGRCVNNLRRQERDHEFISFSRRNALRHKEWAEKAGW